MLNRQGLRRIKTKALRQRVWFQTISRVERGIVDLAMCCVERIRSPVLARTLSKIIGKLQVTVENGFLRRAEIIGTGIAKEICGIGASWGNIKAHSWKYDLSFVRFLGVTAINTKENRI